MSLKQSNPLVTVYIPTFNRVELLKRAVESVRQQTHQNLEIIIVDDCSTDDTHEYLEEIAKQDSRIRYFIKEKNSGACVSRNIAIENAKGEFITGLDDDDYFLKDRIEIFIKKVFLLEKYSALCSSYLIKRPKKTKITRTILSYFLPNEINFSDMLIANFIGNQIFTYTYRLKRYKFNTKLAMWQDLYCWMNLIKKSGKKIYKIKEANYIVDVSHPHERISKNRDKKVIQVYNVFCNDFLLDKRQQDILFLQTVNYGVKINLIRHLKFLITYPRFYLFLIFFSRMKIYFFNVL